MKQDALPLSERPRVSLRAIVFGHPRHISGTVYGIIVVLASLTVGASEHVPWRLEVLVLSSVLTIWVAHVYSEAMFASIRTGARIDRHELFDIARHEFSIPLAAVGPCAALTLGAVGAIPEDRAIQLAFAVGFVVLAVQGVRYARAVECKPLIRVAVMLANLGLGVAIVLLKVLVAH